VKYGLGQGGGIQVYIREFLSALVLDGNLDHEYILMLPPGVSVELPSNNQNFTAFVLEQPPELTLPTRIGKRLSRKLGVADFFPPYASEVMTKKITGLGLDIIHFPATTIDMSFLPPNQSVVLTFFDMQQEFYPEFFSETELQRRSHSYRASVERANMIIAPSAFTSRTLTEKYNVSADRMRVVYGGVSERFLHSPNPGTIKNVRTKYGLPDRFLFYPANPWPHKNHLRLFYALGVLCKKHGIKCDVVTTGKLVEQAISVGDIAHQADYPLDLVHDLGFVPEEDIPLLYRLARMMVFPSLFEGLGMPLLEAMASGCPVACSRNTSLPELGGDAVIYFDPNDVEDIADAIFEVWTNNELRTRLTAQGFARSQKFSWRTAIQQTLKVYEETACAGTKEKPLSNTNQTE
jgi:glycosyltransferase involved in cell wall biosynthesis